MKFLLNDTPIIEHRIETGTDSIKLTQQTKFELSNDDTSTLEWFLQKVKGDTSVRHSCTGASWHLDYDPAGSDLTALCISHRETGHHITMKLATAYQLLDALTGKTEHLAQEE